MVRWDTRAVERGPVRLVQSRRPVRWRAETTWRVNGGYGAGVSLTESR
jgi:hypothetical protein